MGMTIDEAIKYYLNKNIVLTEEEALANTIALNTMRKYQKIEQIISEWTTNMNVNTTMAMCEIEEVVKDGKIDEGEQP